VKNVIFLIAVKNPEHSKKYGGFDWFDYAIKSWSFWCKRNNAELVVYDTPSLDVKEHRITWQRWFDVFDFIESKGITDYDKIFMNDANSIVRWDCPNFFKIIEGDNRIAGFKDKDNLNWIYQSVVGFKGLFNNFDFKISNYVNSNIIFNKTHKQFFKEFKEFYFNNYDDIIDYVQRVKKGTDQTILNYFIQTKGLEVNTSIPWIFNVTHPHRKELFFHNWQLNQLGKTEDKTPHFIKHTYHWKFSGMAKDQRTNLMDQTWSLIKHNYIEDENELLLNSVNHKDTFGNATSRKFKTDILNYFSKSGKNMSLLEFGCCHGDTSKIFSKVFKKVHATDWKESNLNIAKEKCKTCSNIEFSKFQTGEDKLDSRRGPFYFSQDTNVIFIDSRHSYEGCLQDIKNVLNYFNDPIIIMDDYGTPVNDVRKAIDEIIDTTDLEIIKYIGEKPGYITKSGWTMNDREGVILKKLPILNSVRHKNEFNESTTKKYKKDLINYFNNSKNKTVVEFGCCQGDTTKILSSLFKKVYAVDKGNQHLNIAKEKCKKCSNIEFKSIDVYNDEWNFDTDVVIWDIHPGNLSKSDIERDLNKIIEKFKGKTLVIDDYGAPYGDNKWKKAIESLIKKNKLEIITFIGESPGYKTAGGWSFVDREGVICKIN
jgi:ubiquinone/menaquinone biosynthesis C-methylase UbiE